MRKCNAKGNEILQKENKKLGEDTKNSF